MKIKTRQHILFWCFFIALNYGIRMVEYLGYHPIPALYDTFIKYGSALLVFYFVLLYLLPRLNKNRFFLLCCYIVLFIFHGSLRYFIYKYLYPFVDHGYKFPHTYWQSYASSLWFFYQYSIFAYGYYIYHKSKRISANLIDEQQKNHELETKNLKLEYKFLRAQINPHFLYNVLGFFYGKIKSRDENAGRGVELLTAMMRYSIREGEADDKVSLAEELHAVQNLLELQQLRFEGTTYIKATIEPTIGHLRIVPHILVTMVENACKHGDLTHSEDPLEINAYTNDGWFMFEVRNKLRTGRMIELGDGTGLINLEERIRLQYLDQQQFTYGVVDDHFTVIFKLSIKRMESDTLEKKSDIKSSNSILKPTNIKQTVWLPA